MTSPRVRVHRSCRDSNERMLLMKDRPAIAMATRLKKHKGRTNTAKFVRELLVLEGSSIRDPYKAMIATA